MTFTVTMRNECTHICYSNNFPYSSVVQSPKLVNGPTYFQAWTSHISQDNQDNLI